MMLEFHTIVAIVAHDVVLKTSSGSLRQTKAHSKASLRMPVGAPPSSNLLSQKTKINRYCRSWISKALRGRISSGIEDLIFASVACYESRTRVMGGDAITALAS